MRALFLLFCLSVGWAASATTVIAPRFETLVDEAELIFTGQALSQRCEWRNQNGRKSIVTLVTFGVLETHKGQVAGTVTLQFLGGTMGEVALDIAEMPQFKTGERAVLFVAGNGMTASPLIGFFHGRFPLRAGGGRNEVLHYTGEPVGDIAEIGTAKMKSRVAARALTHEEFSEKIQARVASGRKQP